MYGYHDFVWPRFFALGSGSSGDLINTTADSIADYGRLADFFANHDRKTIVIPV